MRDEFIGEKINVEYVQELGWRRPTGISFEKNNYEVLEVVSRWEEHTLGKPWWSRKHRVWYEVVLEDGNKYHLYWDRGPRGKGKDWVLVKRV